MWFGWFVRCEKLTGGGKKKACCEEVLFLVVSVQILIDEPQMSLHFQGRKNRNTKYENKIEKVG